MANDWIEVDWIDNNDTIRTLHQVKTEIQDEIDEIMLDCALILEGYIKAEIKEQGLIDTGYLRANWTAYVEKKMFGSVGVVATNTEYAPYLEEGTRRIKAYKFAEKAWLKAKDEITSYMSKEFKKLAEESFNESGVTPYA